MAEWIDIELDEGTWYRRLTDTPWHADRLQGGLVLININSGSEVLVLRRAITGVLVLGWIVATGRVVDLTAGLTSHGGAWNALDADVAWWQASIERFLNDVPEEPDEPEYNPAA